jgi:hypothetical protein
MFLKFQCQSKGVQTMYEHEYMSPFYSSTFPSIIFIFCHILNFWMWDGLIPTFEWIAKLNINHETASHKMSSFLKQSHGIYKESYFVEGNFSEMLVDQYSLITVTPSLWKGSN